MEHIAFVTCERLPDIHRDDRLVANALQHRGFQVTADFRVQEELGGHGELQHPSRAIGEQARAVLPHAAGPLLYARVDGIERDGGFVPMELEINEPFLYLGSSSGAAERFADAIVGKVR